MTADRRAPRTRVEKVLPLEISPNHQAIVVNFSEEGLGFQTLSPLVRSKTIQFSFVENGERVYASGEVVWMDPTSRMGGLRFAPLPYPVRERLRNWLRQGPAQHEQREETYSGAPSQWNPPGLPPDSAARESPARAQYPPPPEMTWEQRPPAPSFALMEDDPRFAQYAEELVNPGSRRKFFRGFITGALVAAILTAVLALVRSDSVNALLTPGRAALGLTSSPPPSSSVAPPSAVAQPAAVEPTQTAIPTPASPQPPEVSPPEGATEPSGTPLPSTAPEDGAGLDRAPSAAKPFEPAVPSMPSRRSNATPAPKGPEPGDEDVALAVRYLNQGTGPARNATAIQFLWAGIQKGNTRAEIMLADLYARGSGVPQNCNQARVLLRAAAEKGNSEASEKLAEIVRRGCR